jgi:hypothetical protein
MEPFLHCIILVWVLLSPVSPLRTPGEKVRKVIEVWITKFMRKGLDFALLYKQKDIFVSESLE